MMFVQNVEFFTMIIILKIPTISTSVSPVNRRVNTYISFYVIVIYINHFKRSKNYLSVIASESLTVIGIMPIFEMDNIRMKCPYPL